MYKSSIANREYFKQFILFVRNDSLRAVWLATIFSLSRKYFIIFSGEKNTENYSLLGYADYSKPNRMFFYSVHYQCEEP